VDGPRDAARLQHPLGVAYYQGKLYVADTYNNKIKVVDPETGRVSTLAGTGKPGSQDDPPSFDEPAGISAASGKLYVADTNNHLVRVVDLAAGNRVGTLQIAGLNPPEPPAQEPAHALPGSEEAQAGGLAIAAGGLQDQSAGPHGLHGQGLRGGRRRRACGHGKA
jgi:hypothetical protein